MSETAQSRWGPGARRPAEQPPAIFVVGAAGSGAEQLARALASLGACSALGEEPAPVADLRRDGDRRDRTPGGVGARAIRSAGFPTTLVDGAPRRALQVPRLAEVHEGAHFVLCDRPALESATVALDGWDSGLHVTHPDLPGWSGPAWSYALIPRWSELDGCKPAEIVAEQWIATMRILAADLRSLPPERIHRSSHAGLKAAPDAELRRLATATGVGEAGAGRAAGALEGDLARVAASGGPPPAELEPHAEHLREAEAEVGETLSRIGAGSG